MAFTDWAALAPLHASRLDPVVTRLEQVSRQTLGLRQLALLRDQEDLDTVGFRQEGMTLVACQTARLLSLSDVEAAPSSPERR